jgi:hypothetical protein
MIHLVLFVSSVKKKNKISFKNSDHVFARIFDPAVSFSFPPILHDTQKLWTQLIPAYRTPQLLEIS